MPRRPLAPREQATLAPRSLSVSNRHPRLRIPRGSPAKLFEALDKMRLPKAPPRGELSLVFLTDQAMARAHAESLGDPEPTDVITFEGDPLAGLAGEILVSVDTAARLAPEHGHSLARELTLYLIHGYLHLAGYDDLSPGPRRAMRRAERLALSQVARRDALPAFALRG